ncbi:hypothetical protein ARMGADRAFT_1090120 [Armillaria gallica]|uniref:Uncharacterized protein n=1 Tax=Armillaria gallica TaxID=47427 RepID=A0A2H3CHX5_ARMGA|nr:hypothetical protein ARMGADRAFT_1090120 [Armillaria gallica]
MGNNQYVPWPSTVAKDSEGHRSSVAGTDTSSSFIVLEHLISRINDYQSSCHIVSLGPHSPCLCHSPTTRNKSCIYKSRPLPYKDDLCLPPLHGVVSRWTRWLQRSTSEMLPVLKWHGASGTPCVELASSPPTKYYTRTTLRTFAIPSSRTYRFARDAVQGYAAEMKAKWFFALKTRTEGHFQRTALPRRRFEGIG